MEKWEKAMVCEEIIEKLIVSPDFDTVYDILIAYYDRALRRGYLELETVR